VDQTELLNRLKDFFLTFTGIFYEAVPWVVVGAGFAGLVQELPSRRAPAVMLALGAAILTLTISPLSLVVNIGLAAVIGGAVLGLMLLAQPAVNVVLNVLGRHRWVAISLSPLLGLVNPMCDCGVIVVMRRLLRKGLPLSCCVAFILAGPIINVLVAATTYQAFSGKETSTIGGVNLHLMGSWWMLGLRMGLGYLTAVVTAFIIEWQLRLYGAGRLVTPSLLPTGGLPTVDADNDAMPPLGQFLSNVSRTALHDFVDVLVLLIVGALVAAAFRLVFNPRQLHDLTQGYPLVAVGGMIVLAFLITICSEADAFVAAGLNMRPAAQLAFLVFGPMLDLKIFFMYTRVFRPRMIATIILTVFVQVFLYATIIHVLWESRTLETGRLPSLEEVRVLLFGG
jgi:uncharacterized membrane protein YraQ (UPF0718 family)